MANIDLKPCPFCGCDMKIEAVTIDYMKLICSLGILGIRMGA